MNKIIPMILDVNELERAKQLGISNIVAKVTFVNEYSLKKYNIDFEEEYV